VKPICLNLSDCNGLGDLISATPTIKKLSESYQQNIVVLSNHPEIFKSNPYVSKSYKYASVDIDYINANYIVHNSFYNVGKKNEYGVEYKHNMIDIRQFHAIHLGFTLEPKEMDCFYSPITDLKHEIPFDKYVVIHPVSTWENRTWDAIKWMELTERLNQKGIAVVSLGKDSSETGFFNVQKPVFNFEIKYGLNLMNKTSVDDCWHIIKGATCIVTMDSGLMHLAGTTDTDIIQLGSPINNKLRAPYRKGTQGYKYTYVRGSCELMCCSDMKYGVREWGNIQGVAPLIKCLENKEKYECHPDVDSVIEKIIEIFEV
jgi:ADP-heptose:LPS heptosyltransferase